MIVVEVLVLLVEVVVAIVVEVAIDVTCFLFTREAFFLHVVKYKPGVR